MVFVCALGLFECILFFLFPHSHHVPLFERRVKLSYQYSWLSRCKHWSNKKFIKLSFKCPIINVYSNMLPRVVSSCSFLLCFLSQTLGSDLVLTSHHEIEIHFSVVFFISSAKLIIIYTILEIAALSVAKLKLTSHPQLQFQHSY